MKNVYIICLMIISWSAHSESLNIIYDSGNTLSLDDYKERYQDEKEIPKPPFVDQKNNFLPTFPITTPSMSPDIVDPTPVSIPYLQVPLFIIGNDLLSKQWLSERKKDLIRVKAVGMLVEAISLDEVNAIKRLGSGLQIYPASGNDIAKQLNLKHYPVLISPHGIEQ